MSEQVDIERAVIVCPACKAQYKVAADTLGPKGRTVRCARCHTDWRALPVVPETAEPVSAAEEERLDADFAAQEIAESRTRRKDDSSGETAPAGADAIREVEDAVTDPVAVQNRRADLKRRQTLLKKSMPKSRWRKPVRMTSLAVLGLFLVSLLFFRENIVRAFPDLAGLYAAIGLKVNVVGLEFADVTTLLERQDGENVLQISARIHAVSSHQVTVPPVRVGVLDDAGQPVFEWSVTPRAAIMLPGEWIEFKTRLNSPPETAAQVRLLFDLAELGL